MKQIKITENPSKRQTKDNANIWKNKAKLYRSENTALRKRVKAIMISRDSWKTKYKTFKEEPKKEHVLGGVRAKRHQYSLAIVCLILELHKYGAMSLRSCRNSVGCMLVSMGMTMQIGRAHV